MSNHMTPRTILILALGALICVIAALTEPTTDPSPGASTNVLVVSNRFIGEP